MAYADGQHRQGPGGGNNDGQRSTKTPGAHIGQQSGGEQAMNVPKPERGADIETTRGPGGPLPHAATHPDADDKGSTSNGGA